MQHYYPPVQLSWAQSVASLTPCEVAYGIDQGFLITSIPDSEPIRDECRVTLEGGKLIDARDTLFRLLLIHLYKHWFLIGYPLRALEFLVLDFEDCPTASTGNGRLLSGIAGISEARETAELDPDYFEQKVKVLRFLTEFVIDVVREGLRNGR